MPSRSPILFWLLLAATLAVDAVAIFQIFAVEISPRSTTLYMALAFGQLSVICAWVILFRSKVGATWLIPFGVSLPIALIIYVAAMRENRTVSIEPLIAFIGLMCFHAAVVLMSLWLLKPTRLSAPLANVADQRPWQFAVRHLLLVTTCLAFLAFVLSHNEPLVRAILSVISLVAGNAILMIAIVASMRPRMLWPFRLALSLGVAIVIAGVCNQVAVDFAEAMNLRALFLIQSVIIWAWLEIYLPRAVVDAVDDDVPLTPEATP